MSLASGGGGAEADAPGIWVSAVSLARLLGPVAGDVVPLMTPVQLFPGEAMYFETPPLAALNSEGVYNFRWSADEWIDGPGLGTADALQIYGHASLLDPSSGNFETLWQALHRSAVPKCLVFGPASDLDRVRGFVLPMAWRYLKPTRMKFGIGDASNQGVAKLMQSVVFRAKVARKQSGKLKQEFQAHRTVYPQMPRFVWVGHRSPRTHQVCIMVRQLDVQYLVRSQLTKIVN